jgi:hypothetical protein
LNYFTTIEQFFLSLKGSGLALSANDYKIIGDWESRNLPVKSVCRAIEIAYSRFLEQSNRHSERISFIQIQAHVEQQIQEEMYRK